MNDLITVDGITPADVFVPNGLDPFMEKIRKEIDLFIPDMETAKGRKAIKSLAYEVARSKTLLDDLGKGLVADMKKTTKSVDAERKRMRDLLDQWWDEVKQPVTEYEEAEKARENEIKTWLADLEALGEIPTGATVEQIDSRMNGVTESFTELDWGDYEGLANTLQEKVLAGLAERRADRLQYQEQQAELAAQRAENDRLKAEAEKRDELEREAEEAERKRAANAQHRKEVIEFAHGALMAETGLDPVAASKVIQAIDEGNIPHVTISF